MYPRFHEAMCNLAGVYLSMHDTVNAELWLRKANDLSPRNHATYTNMGNVRMLEGRITDAIAFYRQSIEINPAAPVTTYNLGYALVLNGDVVEGLATLRRATRLNPVYGDAYFMIATTLANRLNDQTGAIEAYRQAARLGHIGSQRVLAAMGVAW
jgi:tetratricopeptide (TPR) repeat protein